MSRVTDHEIELGDLYGPPAPVVLKATTNHITDWHRQYLAVATFFCLATGSAEGLDASPRGGPPGFVKVLGPRKIAFADWPGNNRIESLRNIQLQQQVGMCFLFPGLDIFLRINGRASITVETEIIELVAEDKRLPKTATVIEVEEVLFHCGKALNRAALWAETSRIDRKALPSVGTMITELAQIGDMPVEAFDEHYDHAVKYDLY